jgi:hypothetical protein
VLAHTAGGVGVGSPARIAAHGPAAR